MSIIIFSSKNDQTTNDVIDWIYYYGHKFKRMDFNNLLEDTCLTISLSNKEETNIFKSIDGVDKCVKLWFRRDSSQVEVSSKCSKSIQALEEQKQDEIYSLKEVFALIDPEKWLSNFNSLALNKLQVLSVAKKVGLNIPTSIITNNRNTLREFFKDNGVIISKAVSENFLFAGTASSSFRQPVSIVDESIISDLPEIFFPSFFQKLIEKQYDIRCFYLNGKIFSMAILNSSVDFRSSYSSNKNIPFKMPNGICNKIVKLMRKLNLNTGSIDFVRGKDGLYYFLEINPNGQFGMISSPCNYFLEREVAKFLIE